MQIVSDFTAISSTDVWTDGFGDLRQVLTFGFATEFPDYHFDVATAAFRDSYSPLNTAEQTIARQAVVAYQDISALTFIEVAPDVADIVFVGSFDFLLSPADANSIGFAFTPADGQLLASGDVFVDFREADSLDLYLHELGHALGLEHAFEGARVLSADVDTRANTVMTGGNGVANTLGVFDIQAIETMYGPLDQTPPAVLPVVGYADALVSGVSFPFLSSLAIGDTSSIEVEVTNFGERGFGAATTVAMILSADGTASADDVLLGDVAIDDLAAGAASAFQTLSFTIPDCVAPGDYSLIVMVDPNNLVGETDEVNNTDILAQTTITGVQNPNADPADCPSPFTATTEPTVISPPVVAPPVGADVVTGTSAGDVLTGAAGAQQLDGLGGADSISGLGGGDTLNGGGGRDVLNGNGGRDQLNGGGGRDQLNGGGGRDQLNGGGGKDTLDGGGGKDDMSGGGGRDVILGGRGKDQLTGDGGRDIFQFTRGDGRDTITDFRQGADKIGVTDGADSFADLRITDRGDDVMIAFANVRIIVEGDDAANFTAADFLF